MVYGAALGELLGQYWLGISNSTNSCLSNQTAGTPDSRVESDTPGGHVRFSRLLFKSTLGGVADNFFPPRSILLGLEPVLSRFTAQHFTL